MPTKKTTKTTTTKTTAKKKPNQFEHIVSNAINKLVKTHETFSSNSTSSIESLKNLIDEHLDGLMTRINLRKEELDYLDEEFTQKKRRSEIELDLDIQKYGRSKAIHILYQSGEIAVKEAEYNKLKNDYETFLLTQKDEIKNAVKAENDRNTKHIAVLKQTLELKNKAEVATVEAKLEAQLKQISLYNETIQQMKNDLNEQRKLTKDVANASSKSTMYYPPAHSGAHSMKH